MLRDDLMKTRGEAMLVVNNTLQPVEVLEVHTDRLDNVDIKAVALIGERARYLSARFRDRMRLSYGMVSANPFLVDVKNPSIKKVIFNDPATVVIWSDNTKTVVKCQPGDVYSKELGLAMCISKKYLGNKGNFNEEFKKWIPEDSNEELSIEEMKNTLHNFCVGLYCRDCPLNGVGPCYTHANDEQIRHNYNIIKDL